MLVTCPSCRTTYKVSDEHLKDTTPAFRCSRCKHTFEIEETRQANPSPVPKPRGESSSPESAEEELRFKFAAREQIQDPPPAQQKQPLGDFSPAPPPSASHSEEIDEEWAMAQSEGKPETPFTLSPPTEWDKDEKFVDRDSGSVTDDSIFESLPPPQGGDDTITALNPYRDQQASTLPYMTLFALLIICFSVLTAIHNTYPEASQGVVKQIPLVGPAVVRNSHLKNGLALKSIHGNYQTIQGNRDVFVVTGVAMNQNPIVVREVRLGGQTYGDDGNPIEQQSIWVGNALSPKIIRGMTPQDISDLQRLKPLKSFEIPPGDSVPFTIVFLKPTKAIKNFSCEVLAAEGEV